MFQVYTSSEQTLVANQAVEFDSIKYSNQRVYNGAGTTFTIRTPGRYLISLNGVNSGSAEATLQLFDKNEAQPETITTAPQNGTFSFTTLMVVRPSCAMINNTDILQVRATTAATISNVNLVITRL